MKTYGPSGMDIASGGIELKAGGYIIVSFTRSFSANNDIFAMKVGENGGVVWSTLLKGSTAYDWGAAAIEQGNSIYILGYT